MTEKEQLRRLKAFVNAIFNDDGFCIASKGDATTISMDMHAEDFGILGRDGYSRYFKADWLKDEKT